MDGKFADVKYQAMQLTHQGTFFHPLYKIDLFSF
jgi:hypothetical protein